MIRSTRAGIALAFAAVLSVPPCVGAFAQSNGCKKTAQAEGNRPTQAQAEGTRQNQAQAEGTREQLAQAENSSAGGGMYGRQYSQAEGNRQNYANAEGSRQNNAPRLAAGTVPGTAPCP